LELTNNRVIYRIDNAVYVSCNNSTELVIAAACNWCSREKNAPEKRRRRRRAFQMLEIVV